MTKNQHLIYRYDGTFDGLLTCIHRAVKLREEPMMILERDEMQSLLFPEEYIETDAEKARAVADAIRSKICEDALTFARHAQLSTLPGREVYLLSLLRRAFREGPRVFDDLADCAVSKLTRAVRFAEHEAHLYAGFVRFQENGGALTSVIEPKNRVLPLLLNHFCDRFSDETFLIYDKTHREALIHQGGVARILPVEALSLPPADENERAFQALWRGFFRAVAIAPRENPLCQRTHMPKRYWAHMTEMQAEARPALVPHAGA